MILGVSETVPWKAPQVDHHLSQISRRPPHTPHVKSFGASKISSDPGLGRRMVLSSRCSGIFRVATWHFVAQKGCFPRPIAWNFTIHCIIGVGWNVSLGDLGIAHSRVKCHTTRSWISWISDPLPFIALWLGCSSTPNLRLAGAAELWESESPTQLRWFPATGSWPRQLSCFSALTTGNSPEALRISFQRVLAMAHFVQWFTLIYILIDHIYIYLRITDY